MVLRGQDRAMEEAYRLPKSTLLDLGYVVKLPRRFKACVAFVKHESTQPHFASLRSRPAFMGTYAPWFEGAGSSYT